MKKNQSQQTSTFDTRLKKQLNTGQEISSDGLIWRKLSDGTGTWRYDFRINGQRFKGSLGHERYGMTLSAARKLFDEERARATLSTPRQAYNKNSPAYKLFKDVADDYLLWAKTNLNGYRHIEGKFKNHLLPTFSDVILGEITTADVETLKSSLTNSNYDPSTIKKIISLLSSIFNHAHKYDSNITNPTKGLSRIKEIPKNITTLSESEIDELLNSSSNNSKYTTIIGLAAYAGLRASEILGLTWENVDWANNHLIICQRIVEGELKKTTKSGKVRTIPIGNKLITLLKTHKLKSGNNTFLISNKDNRHYHHIQKVFRKIKDLSSIDFKGGIHILRHTFATIAITKGVDLPTVQLWMGHSDIKTTMKYVHINTEHSVEQMKLLG